jgi:CheY-like chemotaxis protein
MSESSIASFSRSLEPILPASLALRETANEGRGRGESELADMGIAVLVVEDDQLIQALVEESLSDGGFESTITPSGEEAVGLLQQLEPRFRALVTDINLSGKLDGWEVARVARETDPAIPVVYMTGTHGDEWTSKGVPNSILLTKPFAPAQLVTAISQLLNAGSPPTAPA